jgi:hypothetical protein
MQTLALVNPNLDLEPTAGHFLSVQLLEDVIATRNSLLRQRGMQRRLRRGSIVFAAQCHDTPDMETRPNLLLFETIESCGQTSLQTPRLASLSRPEGYVEKLGRLERWGTIETQVSELDNHSFGSRDSCNGRRRPLWKPCWGQIRSGRRCFRCISQSLRPTLQWDIFALGPFLRIFLILATTFSIPLMARTCITTT